MKKNNQDLKELITQEKINKYSILSKEETYQQLVEYNQTKVEYNKDTTIHELFEKQVNKTPNNIAVVFENKSLTYKELDSLTNSLARAIQVKYKQLNSKKLTPDTLIALCLNRSLDMIIAIIATLKAGGAYVPVDPSCPVERIAYILEDTATSLVLTQSHLEDSLKNIVLKHEGINNKLSLIAVNEYDYSSQDNSKLSSISTSNNLAYIIYTSGTTGKPKGVMIEHVGVINLAYNQIEKFKITSDEQILQFSNYVFDASVEQITIALLSGNTLHMVTKNTIENIQLLYNYIDTHFITHLHLTPTYLKAIDNLNTTFIKRIIAGGELCSYILYERYKDKLINEYGPTECTITSLQYFISKDISLLNSIPIGRPINNTKLYILDTNLNLIPKGVVGELHIAGDCLARGYLNKQELTNEKFINNPFEENTKLYKTGDLVKYLENSNIEYIGRIDDQVKIRGFRIELGEIEQQLLSIEQIKESAVITKEDSNGYKSLVAYIILNEKINLKDIKLKLSKHLPDYMIPNAIITIETIPLTPNGKTDKKALAKLDVNIESSYQYVAPRDELEEQLAKIFSEVLDINKIGISDNFFELGGNSLLGVILISKINNLLNLSLQIAILFKASTVEKLANIINTKELPSILVEIQTKGSNIPIYAIPGIVGSSLLFKTLSHELGETQPFYGLDIIPNRNCDAKFATAKETAKTNILAIKSIQPNGPYRLIGFCAGGTIAFEMAKLLKKEIDSVILLNAFPNKTKKTFSELKNIIIEIAKYKVKCKLLCLEKNRFFNFAKKTIIRYSNINARKYNKMCYFWFIPEAIDEKLNISLFSVDGDKSKQNWANLIKYDITEIKINGGNETLLNQTNTPSLSKKINSYYESLNKKV